MARPSSSADDSVHGELRYRELALINSPDIIAAADVSAGRVITSRYTDFTLPKGWRAEEVRRTGSGIVDKYYYEPGTGQKFRSLTAVERYVNGEEEQFSAKPLALTWSNSRKRSGPSGSGCSRKMIIFNEKMVKYMEGMPESELASLAARKTAARSHYNLPDGWVVEEVPRRDGLKYGHHVDKYYYEPGSGLKFRSMTTAHKHVAAVNEDRPLSDLVAEIKNRNKPLAKAFKPRSLKASYMRKPTRNGEQPSSPDDLPEKVEWVLDSFQGDAWKPFVGDRAVPDSVSREWSEKFYMAMHTRAANSSALG